MLSVKIAKLEWKRLRDNHRDALKRAKLGKNKLLPAQITTWKYARAMQFLEPYTKYRITENIEMDPCSSKQGINSEQDVSTTAAVHENPRTECPTIKRPRLENVKQNINSTTEKESMPVDALDAFFNCIRQSTREMPQWLQTNVKKKIFAVIIDAEELLALQENNSDTRQYSHNDVSAQEDTRVTLIKNECISDEEEEERLI